MVMRSDSRGYKLFLWTFQGEGLGGKDVQSENAIWYQGQNAPKAPHFREPAPGLTHTAWMPPATIPSPSLEEVKICKCNSHTRGRLHHTTLFANTWL